MNLTDLENLYGTPKRAMQELERKGVKIYRQLWQQWRDGIPHGRQCEIELATKGKLKADKRK
jgi:hypothetical protein